MYSLLFFVLFFISTVSCYYHYTNETVLFASTNNGITTYQTGIILNDNTIKLLNTTTDINNYDFKNYCLIGNKVEPAEICDKDIRGWNVVRDIVIYIVTLMFIVGLITICSLISILFMN